MPWSSLWMRKTNYFLNPSGRRSNQPAWWVLTWCSYNNNKRRKERTNCKEDGAVLNLKKKSHKKKLCWSVAVEVVRRMMHLKMMTKNLKIQVKAQALLLLLHKTEVANPLCQHLWQQWNLLSDRAAMMIVFESIRALGQDPESAAIKQIYYMPSTSKAPRK